MQMHDAQANYNNNMVMQNNMLLTTTQRKDRQTDQERSHFSAAEVAVNIHWVQPLKKR